MQKLNLANIAQQVGETFEDVETTFGTVRVYHVPDAVVWAFKPDWTPTPPPPVDMALASGQKQRRAAKATDPGFAEYQAEQERHEQEKDEIQWAARYVLALRDVEYPANLSKPPSFLANDVNGSYPGESPNDFLRKYFWLNISVLSKAVDRGKVTGALILQNSGKLPTPDNVDDVKKSSGSDTEDAESEPEAA